MDIFSALIALTSSRATTDVKSDEISQCRQDARNYIAVEHHAAFFMKLIPSYGDRADVTTIGLKGMYKNRWPLSSVFRKIRTISHQSKPHSELINTSIHISYRSCCPLYLYWL